MQTVRYALSIVLFWTACIPAWAEGSDDHQPDSQSRDQPVAAEHTRHYPALPILGYVTPWNPRGKQLVEDYRDSFDMIAPVWYQILANEDRAEVYSIQGGPPDQDDERWYQRLQQPSFVGLKALRIMPRFFLDGWNQNDYRQLAINETRWPLLTKTIMRIVDNMSFDGIVLESAAPLTLQGLLSELSARLWEHEKTVIVVIPPLRNHADSSNSMIEQTVTLLTDTVDYFSVMTYDMTGPGGIEWEEPFPKDSPLFAAQKQHNIRVPGPNTSAAWIRSNIVALSGPRYKSTHDDDPELRSMNGSVKTGSGTLLMGLPLYGYKYPVLFVDADTGTILQERTKGNGKKMCILRGSGEAIVMSQIEDLIQKYQPTLHQEDANNQEQYFDYLEDDGYWRVYLPTPQGMSESLGIISRGSETLQIPLGVALWEVGQISRQKSTELLVAL